MNWQSTRTSVFFFFFSSRRRHTRYWRDWSSDVCSSDLQPQQLPVLVHREAGGGRIPHVQRGELGARRHAGGVRLQHLADRKSVVEGKSVDLGGRRIIKKKKKKESIVNSVTSRMTSHITY